MKFKLKKIFLLVFFIICTFSLQRKGLALIPGDMRFTQVLVVFSDGSSQNWNEFFGTPPPGEEGEEVTNPMQINVKRTNIYSFPVGRTVGEGLEFIFGNQFNPDEYYIIKLGYNNFNLERIVQEKPFGEVSLHRAFSICLIEKTIFDKIDENPLYKNSVMREIYILEKNLGNLRWHHEFNNPPEKDLEEISAIPVDDGLARFTEDELNYGNEHDSWQIFSPLDELGRPTICIARLSRMITLDTQLTSRPRIPEDPLGWGHNIKIGNGYLLNRCHLIGWQLTGDPGQLKNLITGTRSFNVPGMSYFEDLISRRLAWNPYIHILYRVIPIFFDNEIIPRGVVIEAKSIEDNGGILNFLVFLYNQDPNFDLDYQTGEISPKQVCQATEPS